MTTTTTSAGYVYDAEQDTGSDWTSPNDWGALQWIVIIVAPMVTLFACCKAISHAYQRKVRHQKIYVASDGKEKTNWDFSNAGTVAVDEIIETDEALVKASTGGERTLIFSEGNRLKAQHLLCISDILTRHTAVKVRLGSDWLGATDETLEALANVLRVPGRSQVKADVQLYHAFRQSLFEGFQIPGNTANTTHGQQCIRAASLHTSDFIKGALHGGTNIPAGTAVDGSALTYCSGRAESAYRNATAKATSVVAL